MQKVTLFFELDFKKNSYAVLPMHLQLMHHPIARALTNGVQQLYFLGLSLHTGYT